jgi:uncharacterized protein (TIGR02466 family)|tara:strand:- start:6022 stop:6645 length:624 start_codon:yes stop_codon:yes gene_type:complete
MKQNENILFFSHAVGYFDLSEEMESMNKELITLAFRMEKNREKAVSKSNQGGYQSDFLLDSEFIVRRWKKILIDVVARFGKSIHLKEPFTIHVDKPWLNVNRKNHHNITHTHGGNDFSVVYYIEVPENSGRLVFENPVLHQRTTTLWYDKHDMWNSEFIYVTPQKHNLIIFPSYLPHFVEPNKSKKPRISLACNLSITNEKNRRLEK